MNIYFRYKSIQGIPVSTIDPVSNQILQYNGTNWTPATMALPMVRGTVTIGSDQVINMADYTNVTSVGESVKVPSAYITLPPGQWLLFHNIPFRFNFTNTSIAQVGFLMGFAPEDNSNTGTSFLTKFVNGTVVNGISHRDVTMGIINNTTNGNVKYTFRVGNFHFINNSGVGIPVSGTMTVMPPGMGGHIYAIGVK